MASETQAIVLAVNWPPQDPAEGQAKLSSSSKSFLNNAPKFIVQKEKNSLLQSNVELKKLNSILNSIKN